ncbi:MAG: EAL domain-containing protein [Proteobacteria bacterium]|uniref:EAL domain-containing protein n=1 Tax=Rudaea sp. TaxID=2136325 RepID=UPI003783390B|nr:EAL domain-containing protein [Pseudomonadota bacterium]
MSKPTDLIKLLLAESSVEDAERLTSILRNAGIAVRATQARDVDELEVQLQTQTPDLILSGSAIDLGEVVAAANRGGKDIAVVAILESISGESITEAFRGGVVAAAARDFGDLLVAVIQREFDNLNQRRNVRRLEASLAESERRCDSLLESARDPIAYVHEGAHVRANQAWLEAFGYANFEELQGASILDLIAPEATSDFKVLLKDLSRGEKPPPNLPIKVRRADGATFDTIMEFAPASVAGEPCQQIVLRQPQANPELARQIDALRTKDLVTDLYNRQHGLTELDRMVAAAAAGAPNQVLLLLEADNFRQHLDAIGLGNTDLLLGDMANLLRRNLESIEHVAFRFGDQTFGVLSTALPIEAAAELAQRLCNAFSEHDFDIGKQNVSLFVSISGVLIGEKNANAQAVLNQAGAGLRELQQRGGNQVTIYDPGLRDAAMLAEAQQLRERVEDAVTHNRFSLYSQPIINLHGVEGEFYEILARLVDDKGEVMPTVFLPVAEDAGVMPAIDRIVIASAITTLAEREKAGRHTTFFVKLTAPSMADETLLPWIAQQLKSARVRGDALVFEVPESKVVTQLKVARTFVNGLSQLHCGFALEQFGAGVNSFQLLKHIDASYLKIDRSYMQDLPKDKEHQEFIRQFCHQAHQAGKIVIAEHVENAASMSILFTCGVNFVQGNYLNEPEKILSAA